MARNLKRDYLKKLAGIEKNGYKIDLANYIYNPSFSFDYPSFHKIEKSENENIVTRFYYMKHYDGSGEYIKEVYSVPNEESSWHITKTLSDETIQTSDRFSLKTLESLVC